MNAASVALDFERAARFRDRLRAMSHIQARQGVNPSTFSDADLFAAFSQGGQTCIQVFFFRAGQTWGTRPYFPRADRDLASGEVLESLIGQFYDDRRPPPLILVSDSMPEKELLAEALSLKAERKVEILVPQRGEKREILEMGLQNAREQLARRLAENSAQRELLDGVAETFGLDAPPRRIEVYDNSHIQGASAVGAMIVAGADGFEKNEYRKFNIQSAEFAPGDDYGMMREVLTRRFARLVREAEDTKARWPDLVLIDGGPGQLAVAQSVLEDLGVEDVLLVGVAKGPDRDAGREHLHMKGREPFRLDPKSPVLYYLQRLRDEAHRFAIGTHRKKRAKALGANPLDEIDGVGAARKRALLQHFGSARAVAGASLSDLEAVSGVSGALARKIHDFFHPRG
jgi:excinuclease ABC subunit C